MQAAAAPGDGAPSLYSVYSQHALGGDPKGSKKLTDRFVKTDDTKAIEIYKVHPRIVETKAALKTHAHTLQTASQDLRRRTFKPVDLTLKKDALEEVQRQYGGIGVSIGWIGTHVPVIIEKGKISKAFSQHQKLCIDFIRYEKEMVERLQRLSNTEFHKVNDFVKDTFNFCYQTVYEPSLNPLSYWWPATPPLQKFDKLNDEWPNRLKKVTDLTQAVQPLLTQAPHINVAKRRQNKELFRTIMNYQLDALRIFKQAINATKTLYLQPVPPEEKAASDLAFEAKGGETRRAVEQKIKEIEVLLQHPDIAKKPLPLSHLPPAPVEALDRQNIGRNASPTGSYVYYGMNELGKKFQSKVAVDLVALDATLRIRLNQIAKGVPIKGYGHQSLLEDYRVFLNLFNEIQREFKLLVDEYTTSPIDTTTSSVFDYAHLLHETIKDVRIRLKLVYKASLEGSEATSKASELIKNHLKDRSATHPAVQSYQDVLTLYEATQAMIQAIEAQAKPGVRQDTRISVFVNNTQYILHRILQVVFPNVLTLTSDEEKVPAAIIGNEPIANLAYPGEEWHGLPVKVVSWLLKRLMNADNIEDIPIDIDLQVVRHILSTNHEYSIYFAESMKAGSPLQKAFLAHDRKVAAKSIELNQKLLLSEPKPDSKVVSQLEQVSAIYVQLYKASRSDARDLFAYGQALQGYIEFCRNTRADLSHLEPCKQAKDFISKELTRIARNQKYIHLVDHIRDLQLEDWKDVILHKPDEFKRKLMDVHEQYRMRNPVENLQGLLVRILSCCLYSSNDAERFDAHLLAHAIIARQEYEDFTSKLDQDVLELVYENTKQKLTVQQQPPMIGGRQIPISEKEKELLKEGPITAAIEQNQFSFSDMGTSHALIALLVEEKQTRRNGMQPLANLVREKVKDAAFLRYLRSYELLEGFKAL